MDVSEVQILSVSDNPEDHEALRHILSMQQWNISAAGTCSDAIGHLIAKPSPIVICEKEISDGTWHEILNQVSRSAVSSVLIVTSRLADDYLWAEVLNLGGFDVLAKPFNEREVRHVVASAWTAVSGPARACAAGR